MKLYYKHYLLLILSLILLVSSCKENELKQPVSVNFLFSMDSSEYEHLNFNHGILHLSSFTFDGKRAVGDDVFFNIEYSTPLEIEFDEATNIYEELSFDLPQGIYDDITITLSFASSETPVFSLDGTYIDEDDEDDEEIDFIYEDFISTVINIKGISNTNQNQIILDKNNISYPVFKINPNLLFSTITVDEWEDADVEEEEEEEEDFILINSEDNNSLYSEMKDQFSNAISLIFM